MTPGPHVAGCAASHEACRCRAITDANGREGAAAERAATLRYLRRLARVAENDLREFLSDVANVIERGVHAR